MTYNYKKIIAGALVLFSFLPTSFAFAERKATKNTPARQSTVKQTKLSDSFCANLSTLETRSAEQIANAEIKKSKNEQARGEQLIKSGSDADTKIAESRSSVDEKRLQNWSSITSKAKTRAQKTAVEAYKTAINNAVLTRRLSIDSAIKVYREALNRNLVNHSGSIDQAIATFKASINTSLAKAKADCNAGIDSSIARATYNKSMTDAKEALTLAHRTADVAMGISTIKQARDNAVKTANEGFKTTTKRARADLLSAFK